MIATTTDTPDPQVLGSLQDLVIYRLVKVQALDPEVVADRLEVTFPEVNTIVARMQSRLCAAAPIEEDPAEVRRRKYVAEQVAAERLHFLFCEALRCYKRSRGVVTTTRQVGNERPLTTTRTSNGDDRYLKTACRISELAMQVCAGSLDQHLLDWEAAPGWEKEFEEEFNDELVAKPDTATPVEAQNHPVEDCSAPAARSEVTSIDAPVETAAKDSALMACARDVLQNKPPKIRSAPPVQRAAVREADAPKEKTKARVRAEFFGSGAS